jgi:hypothetical protein
MAGTVTPKFGEDFTIGEGEKINPLPFHPQCCLLPPTAPLIRRLLYHQSHLHRCKHSPP